MGGGGTMNRNSSQIDSVLDRSAVFPAFMESRKIKLEILEEQQQQWESGLRPDPAELLGRWPVDPQADPDAASVLYEDLLQRRLLGDDANPEEYSQRFPAHEKSLA